MSKTPDDYALRATRNIHTLSMKRSGFSYLGDIPLGISVSTIGTDANGAKQPFKMLNRSVQIKPDVARLLDPEHVPDALYEQIQADAKALTEGEGAERLNALLNVLCGQANPKQRRPIRYSLCGRHDMQLIRNFLWREGYSWQQAEGKQSAGKIIDVRHALIIVAGINRVMGFESIVPDALKDYDLDPRDVTANDLCRHYEVPIPRNCSESSALLRLMHAARVAEYTPAEKGKSEPPSRRPLRALGAFFDHLEGIAGILAEDDAVGDAKKRAQQLIAPVRDKVELSPSDVGLLHYNGAWLPVVQPLVGATQGTYRHMYTLPDGRPLPRHVNTSAPLARLDILASDGQWDAAADERLRQMCGREGEPFSFQSLKAAFKQSAGTWPPPEAYTPSEPTAKPNSWTRIYDGWPNDKHYQLAAKATEAINRNHADAAYDTLDQLTKMAGKARGDTREGVNILLENLKLVASRANLMNDGREDWLKQMALLPDPEAWPGNPPIEADALPINLYGDGPVAKHNQMAIANRSSRGISASKAARAAVSATPRTVAAAHAIN